MKRKLIIIFVLTLPMVTNAQWKVGIGGGPSCNVYNFQQRNWVYDICSWGVSAGIFGQYDISDYFGLRTELNWTQKNHFKYLIYQSSDTGYKSTNNYIQIPIMATGALQWGKFKPFLNLGLYAAYWISSCQKSEIEIIELKNINGNYNNKMDFGLVGGIGLEFHFAKHLALQVEGRCYYSTISSKKEIDGIYNSFYNTTYVFQPSLLYYF